MHSHNSVESFHFLITGGALREKQKYSNVKCGFAEYVLPRLQQFVYNFIRLHSIFQLDRESGLKM